MAIGRSGGGAGGHFDQGVCVALGSGTELLGGVHDVGGVGVGAELDGFMLMVNG